MSRLVHIIPEIRPCVGYSQQFTKPARRPTQLPPIPGPIWAPEGAWYSGYDLFAISGREVDALRLRRAEILWAGPPEVRQMIRLWDSLEEQTASREYVARIRSHRYVLKPEGGWADRTR